MGNEVLAWFDRRSTAGQRWTASLCLVVALLVLTLGLPRSAPRLVVATDINGATAGPAGGASTAVGAPGPSTAGGGATDAPNPAGPSSADGTASTAGPPILSGPAVAESTSPAGPATPSTGSPAPAGGAGPAPAAPPPPPQHAPPPAPCKPDPTVAALAAQLDAAAKQLGPLGAPLVEMIAKAVTCV